MAKSAIPQVMQSGVALPPYQTKEDKSKVWRLVMQYELDKLGGRPIRQGTAHNVLLVHPTVKEWTKAVSIGGLLEALGVPKYTDKGNGKYNSNQAIPKLKELGYNLLLAEGWKPSASKMVQCVNPKCKKMIVKSSNFCQHCSAKQPELEKGKSVSAPLVAPTKKVAPRKPRKPNIEKATLVVEAHEAPTLELPILPPSFAEMDQAEVKTE